MQRVAGSNPVSRSNRKPRAPRDSGNAPWGFFLPAGRVGTPGRERRPGTTTSERPAQCVPGLGTALGGGRCPARAPRRLWLGETPRRRRACGSCRRRWARSARRSPGAPSGSSRRARRPSGRSGPRGSARSGCAPAPPPRRTAPARAPGRPEGPMRWQAARRRPSGRKGLRRHAALRPAPRLPGTPAHATMWVCGSTKSLTTSRGGE